MVLDFVLRVVADDVEAFEVVCEEDFEVCVVCVVVESGVDVVVVCAGVGGVLDFKVLDEDEVFDDLDVFDLAVLGEEGADHGFSRIVHPTHV